MTVHPITLVAIAGIVLIAVTGHRNGAGVFGDGQKRLASLSVYLVLAGFAGMPVNSGAVATAALVAIGLGVAGFGVLVVRSAIAGVCASASSYALEKKCRAERQQDPAR